MTKCYVDGIQTTNQINISVRTPMKRLHALDTVKFLFSIIIVFFHLFYSNMKPYIGETELFQLAAIAMRPSGAIVECFLIIAGYFIYTGFKKANKSFATYVSDRLIRLWPVFAFYCLCCVFLVNCNFQDLFLDLCFLRCTGISLEYRGIIWYIPPFFWCSLLIYAILKAFSRQKAILLLAVLMYICYAVNINHLNGSLGRETIHKWLSLGMLHVMGGLCAGVLVAVIKEMWFQQDILSPKRKYVCISLIEALSLGTLTWHFLIEKLYNNAIISVIIFSILFLCLLSNSGLISRILSWSPLAYCGRFCYSIYVMQQISFWILARLYWKPYTESIQQHPALSIALSGICSILIGIATYYLVEAPAIKLWYRFKKA